MAHHGVMRPVTVMRGGAPVMLRGQWRITPVMRGATENSAVAITRDRKPWRCPRGFAHRASCCHLAPEHIRRPGERRGFGLQHALPTTVRALGRSLVGAGHRKKLSPPPPQCWRAVPWGEVGGSPVSGAFATHMAGMLARKCRPAQGRCLTMSAELPLIHDGPGRGMTRGQGRILPGTGARTDASPATSRRQSRRTSLTHPRRG